MDVAATISEKDLCDKPQDTCNFVMHRGIGQAGVGLEEYFTTAQDCYKAKPNGFM